MKKTDRDKKETKEKQRDKQSEKKKKKKKKEDGSSLDVAAEIGDQSPGPISGLHGAGGREISKW